MRITRKQIMDCLDSHIKDTITDAEWFICLVKNFMALLDEDEFNSDDLINLNYIRTVLEENKKNEHAKSVLMCNEYEKYIVGLFSAILAFIESNEKKCDEKTNLCEQNKVKTAKEAIIIV